MFYIIVLYSMCFAIFFPQSLASLFVLLMRMPCVFVFASFLLFFFFCFLIFDLKRGISEYNTVFIRDTGFYNWRFQVSQACVP